MTATDYACSLALALDDHRVALGMSRAAFARHVGMSGHNLLLYWGGTQTREPSLPSLRVLLRVATALGTTPAGLLAEAEALMEDDR
jgi:transcriptional regulator with XRE-family HTH domain